jgi:hypothetical protein
MQPPEGLNIPLAQPPVIFFNAFHALGEADTAQFVDQAVCRIVEKISQIRCRSFAGRQCAKCTEAVLRINCLITRPSILWVVVFRKRQQLFEATKGVFFDLYQIQPLAIDIDCR